MKSPIIEQHTATKAQPIELAAITTRGLQTRTGTDSAKVAEYAELYRAGTALPPIVVYHDGERYWCADGHHRLAAAKRAELAEIDCIVKRGTQRDALWYACAANAQHGLPRTNEDKRRIVELLLADAEWRALSDRALAQHASVSDRLVGKMRKELGHAEEARTGRDGKVRNPKKKQAPAHDAQQPQATPSEPQPEAPQPAADLFASAPPSAAAGPEEIIDPATTLPDRRTARVRQLVADAIEADPGACARSTARISHREWCLLALIVGIDTDELATWCDDRLATSQADLDSQFAANLAAAVRRADAHLPDLATICRLWGLDHEAQVALAQRQIPD
jgi:ParB-like chromosome segregation protein Spo0J